MKILAKQIDFAEWGGVKTNSQVNYESGKTPPTVEYLLGLEQHGVDIGYILTGRRNDPRPSGMEPIILEMFGKLSMREREAVFNLMATLATHTISLHNFDEIAKQGQQQRQSLQDQRLNYRQPDQKD